MPPVDRNRPVTAKSSTSRYSLTEFMREFPDDKTCLEWLWRTRYSHDGINAQCPKCEEVRPFARYGTSQQRQSWTCTACGQHVHPTAGTIFHKSSTSLHLWFYAMYLMTSTRCGISARQMERELGCHYKTALRMVTLIREQLMEQDEAPMRGPLELDESYFGGRRRGKFGKKAKSGRPGADSHKVAVFGIAQRREGKVVAIKVPSVRRRTLGPIIQRRVLPASTVYTDEFVVYDDLGRRGYHHRRVNHSEEVWVSGRAHTNTLEGFWSLAKNGIRGVYHSVSSKHLQGYLNEYAWRYNHRNDERAQFETLLLRAAGR